MTFFRLYTEWIIGFIILFMIIGIINADEINARINSGSSTKNVMAQVVLKNQEGYILEEGEHVEVYYKPNAEDYKDMIIRMGDLYYPLIARDFSYDIDKKATIILYSTKKDMASELKMSIKDVPMGAYCNGILSVLSPDLWVDSDNEVVIRERFMEDGPVVHELTHLVLDKKVSGKYPLWFTEGVALYYEYKYLNFEWRKDLSQKAQKISLMTLESSFKALENGPAYRKSYEIIKAIVDEYGEDGLQDLIFDMKSDGNFKKAYVRVFGKNNPW